MMVEWDQGKSSYLTEGTMSLSENSTAKQEYIQTIGTVYICKTNLGISLGSTCNLRYKMKPSWLLEEPNAAFTI